MGKKQGREAVRGWAHPFSGVELAQMWSPLHVSIKHLLLHLHPRSARGAGTAQHPGMCTVQIWCFLP